MKTILYRVTDFSSEPFDVIWTWRWRSQVKRVYDVIVTPKALHFENVQNLEISFWKRAED